MILAWALLTFKEIKGLSARRLKKINLNKLFKHSFRHMLTLIQN